MPRIPRIQAKGSHLAAVFLLALLLGQCLFFAWDTGQTTDETFFNGSGYPMVRYNDYRILGEHPPLMAQLGSLPLLFLQPKYPIDKPIYIGDSTGIDLTLMGSKFLYEMGNAPRLILFLERIPIIVITVLLGFFLFRWSSELFGRTAALLSLFLYSLSPNIIANGSLFTTDLGVAAFFFLTIYYASRFFKSLRVRDGILIGIFLALAVLSKTSGILLIPILFLTFLVEALCARGQRTFGQLPRSFNWIIVSAAVIVFIGSVGEKSIFIVLAPIAISTIVLTLYPFIRSKQRWARLLFIAAVLAGWTVSFVLIYLVAQKRHWLFPLAALLWNLVFFTMSAYLTRRDELSYPRFLMKIFSLSIFITAFVVILDYTDFVSTFAQFDMFGHYARTFHISLGHAMSRHQGCVEGSWIKCDARYFMSAMVVKTPLLTLALALIGIFIVLKSRLLNINKWLILFPPVCFLLIASVFNQVKIGVRHALPVYPFLFLLAGSVAHAISKMNARAPKITAIGVLAAALFWHGAFVMGHFPHYLSYFNELVGSAENGAMLTSGSNVVWGQDNRRLAELVSKKRIPFIKISTSSNNPAEYNHYGLKWAPMDTSNFENPLPGYYALDLHVFGREQRNPNSWFKGKKPIYPAGETIYVFQVPQ